MAQSKDKADKDETETPAGIARVNETLDDQRQAYTDWVTKKAEFDAGNPTAEERTKWVESNPEYADPHPCEECNGTGIAGGPPPKPLVRTGAEPIVERAARTHSEIEETPSGKSTKKDAK